MRGNPFKRTFDDMRHILLAALLMASTSALADDTFQPWQQCAARLMGHEGTLWDVAYYPEKHPDHLGYAMIDAEGYASVWAPANKPWVQLHEACHVIQMARGENMHPMATPAQEAECKAVQQSWRECR